MQQINTDIYTIEIIEFCIDRFNKVTQLQKKAVLTTASTTLTLVKTVIDTHLKFKPQALNYKCVVIELKQNI